VRVILGVRSARWIGVTPATRGSCETFGGCKMSVMDVELLVVPDCPNESVALTVLRLAFDRVGLAAQSVRTTVISSREQAQDRGFVGSPTILIDGVDPFGVAGQSPAFACRVYVTPAGLSGAPPLGDVISALTAARARGPAWPE
jgi:hypothetical protein